MNIEIVPVDGDKGWRVKPHQIIKAPDGAVSAPAPAVLPILPPLYPAQVVTVTGSGWKEPADKLWIVLKGGPSGKASVARLGSDSGRCWRVPRSFVEPVEIDSVVLKPCTPADGR